jgi:hypothetical protein
VSLVSRRTALRSWRSASVRARRSDHPTRRVSCCCRRRSLRDAPAGMNNEPVNIFPDPGRGEDVSAGFSPGPADRSTSGSTAGATIGSTRESSSFDAPSGAGSGGPGRRRTAVPAPDAFGTDGSGVGGTNGGPDPGGSGRGQGGSESGADVGHSGGVDPQPGRSEVRASAGGAVRACGLTSVEWSGAVAEADIGGSAIRVRTIVAWGFFLRIMTRSVRTAVRRR